MMFHVLSDLAADDATAVWSGTAEAVYLSRTRPGAP
jgi:hypothetical protein